jgi:hypothetical protein
MSNGMLDIGYWIQVYSNLRYNVGLRSLQSDIRSSDIQLSPISLITDIGLSAHLWLSCCLKTADQSNNFGNNELGQYFMDLIIL